MSDGITLAGGLTMRSELVQVPLRRAPAEIIWATGVLPALFEVAHKTPHAWIAIEKLFRTQRSVEIDVVLKYRRDLEEMPPVRVCRYRGYAVLIDGHHRVVACLLAGKRRVFASLEDLPDPEVRA